MDLLRNEIKQSFAIDGAGYAGGLKVFSVPFK